MADSLNIDGFDDFADELEEFQRELNEAKVRFNSEVIDEGTERTAELLKKEMQNNVIQMGAVDSGELLQSIKFTSIESGYIVGPTADHAVYVEYGTGVWAGNDRIEPQDAEALAFEVDGETVFAASVEGMRPRPFFRNAVRRAEEEDWLPRALAEEMEDLFDEVFN